MSRAAAGRDELRAIARRAMTARGLLPEFSPAALAESEALAEIAVDKGPAAHDLRALAWASIDNDDTHDLDQLQVAEPLAGAAVKLLVAVADVDARVAGLAVRDYTHSTAPNRRFPDLATQRLLKAAIAGAPCAYTNEQLTELARHCTLQEDNAAKVERQVRKSAAALLLAPRLGQRFDAVVTGASPKGTWVRIRHPAVEGRFVRGEHGLDVGDALRVELVHTDVERGFIDFVRA